MTKRARGHRGTARVGGARAHALNILVVENHSDTRQGLKAFLKALRHRASFAEGKTEALALARRADYDLLLSDISLPDGNGWELLQDLDAQGCRPAHAIAMSGLGDPADQSRSRDAGFELHLVKPFRPQQLEDALRQVAASSSVPPAAPTVSPVSGAPAAPDLRQRLHDGLAQHLAAAALLHAALTNRLEALSISPADPTAPLKDAVTESRRISQLLDEALAETLSLMRAVQAGS